MKKITLIVFTFLTFSLGHAQTTLFSDDFESYNDFIISGIGNWLTLDLDGLPTYTGTGTDTNPPTYPNAYAPMAFQIFNPSTTTPTAATNSTSGEETRNFDPHSGSKYAAAWAAVPSTSGGPTANNDWLVSPSITLAASGNTATFWVKALSNTYGSERYNVGVYSGTGIPTGSSDFTIIGSANRTAPYPNWQQISIDLSPYNNQTVRIGIHYISSDVYMFMVDDFSINTTLSVNEFASNVFSYSYDKNSNLLSIESSNMAFDTIQLFNVIGQEVMHKTLSQTSEVINLSSFNDGIYIAKISIEGQTQTIKILKQ